MNCPLCDKELVRSGWHGMFCLDDVVIRYVWKCPNGLEQNGSCESSEFKKVGSFLTDKDSLSPPYERPAWC